MAKREPLYIPLDFEATVKALLQTPPPPGDTQGSRKAVKPKARNRGRKKPARKGV